MTSSQSKQIRPIRAETPVVIAAREQILPQKLLGSRLLVLLALFFVSIVLLLSVLVVSAPTASAAETADWLPLKGSYDKAIGCTWPPNGCGLPNHTETQKGIDFIVPLNTKIYAAGPGEVTSYEGCHPTDSPGCNGKAGNYVVITHPDKRQSRYLHLASIVKNLDTVSRGDLIGYSGNSGGSPVPHLHYDEWVGGLKGAPTAGGSNVAPGGMKAVHGDSLKQYPNVLGYDTWNNVPHHGNHTLRNDSFKVPLPRSVYTTYDSTRDCSGAEEGQPPWFNFFYLPDAGGCIAEGAEGNPYGLLVNDLNKVVFHADTGERLGVAKDRDPDLFRGANSVTQKEFCEALEAIPDQAMTPQSYLKQHANVKERLILDPNRDGTACTAKDSRAKIGRFIKGTPRNNDLRGTSGNDIIYGLGGDDTIRSLGGSDLIRGGGGNDSIYSGAGNDTTYGGPGNNTIRGGGGNDRLVGGTGKDRLYGQGGKDRLSGRGGTDRLIGGPGVDRLYGQNGNDFLNVRDKKPKDVAHGGGGKDRCAADRGDRRISC